MDQLLHAESLAKSFAGVHALRSASLDLRRGEVHALVGENGAGKSTLIKIIAGAIQPDAGTLMIDGHAVTRYSPSHARALGVAVIYQQPSLFPHLTVTENMALTLEPSRLWRRIDWDSRTARARQLLARVGASLDPERLVETLSMPEQQLVEIAKAIGTNAKILILDEPTASLADREVENLFGVIRGLRDDNVGIVYISHRLEEVTAIADRVTVLRDGETIDTRPMPHVTRGELIRLMVGREVSAVFPKRDVPLGDVLLDVRHLRCDALRVREVSFTVRRGEIFGLAGLVGSGRTETARLLFGLAQRDGGTVLLRGKPVDPASPAEAIALGLAYVPEDRRQHGVVLDLPLTANISLASLESVSNYALINGPRERALTCDWVDRLRIKTDSIFALATMLSGGNQQKVAIARWLARSPDLIILDEPTQGVDVGSKSEIHGIMVDLAAQGCGILMISSEMPEILGMSDRVAVMHDGRVAGILNRNEADQQSIMSLALGHSLPGKEHLQ